MAARIAVSAPAWVMKHLLGEIRVDARRREIGDQRLWRRNAHAEENERLTLTGPGTPCGDLLRRYWQPVALSSELRPFARSNQTHGEDLVLFRDDDGQPDCSAAPAAPRRRSQLRPL